MAAPAQSASPLVPLPSAPRARPFAEQAAKINELVADANARRIIVGPGIKATPTDAGLLLEVDPKTIIQIITEEGPGGAGFRIVEVEACVDGVNETLRLLAAP